MSTFDLTVAITAHAETLVAGPMIRSAEAAIARLEALGFRVERLIGMDSCTPGCAAYFGQPQFDGWSKTHYEFADQGQTRNALVDLAKGKWFAFLDADDLFSENWLVEAVALLSQAEADGRDIIVHPELNWGFDAGSFVFVTLPQDDPQFTPWFLLVSNLYDALCVAPTRVWQQIPFANRALSDGFAYEDWQWSVETMAANWVHVCAPDTIIFKRRRDDSQSHDSKRNSASIRMIEPLTIDHISKLGKPNDTAQPD